MIHTVHLHVLYISYLRLMILNISWVCTTFSRGFPLLVPCSTSSWLIFSQSEKVTGRAPLSEQRHEERLRVHALGGAAHEVPTKQQQLQWPVVAHQKGVELCHT